MQNKALQLFSSFSNNSLKLKQSICSISSLSQTKPFSFTYCNSFNYSNKVGNTKVISKL